MDIVSIKHIKNICKELDIQPTKSKGQNFLINQTVADRIIQAADLDKADRVLEIGPGFGVLTFAMAQQVEELIAVELDKKLVSYLELYNQRLKQANIKIIQGDILKLLVEDDLIGAGDYKVVANLPYQITSRVLRLLLGADNPPSVIVVMVQQEVAERICAQPGKMSILSVMVQYYGQPKIVRRVTNGNFWPQPKVDSAVLRIDRLMDRRDKHEELFFKLVKIGFSSKRKMLKNNLANAYKIEKVEKVLNEMGLDLKVRAQELSLEEWLGLSQRLN